MRIQPTLALLAAAALSLSPSAFAAPAASGAAEGPIASVHINGASIKPLPADFDGVQGSYTLSDGRTLRVSSAHRKLYADLGAARFELVPVAQNVFESRADGMRLAFDQAPYATEVTLSAPAR